MDAYLKIISKFEQRFNVRILYSCDPCDLTYVIQMRSGEKVVGKHITGLPVSGESLIDCLFELYSKLFEKEIEPEPEPQETQPYTNCPNCGAVVTSRKCEYCGTIHWWFEEEKEERIEREILEKERDRLQAELHKLQSAARIEELYDNALTAMRHYVMTPDEVREAAGLNQVSNTLTACGISASEANFNIGKMQEVLREAYVDAPFGVKKPEQSPGIVLEPVENPLKKLFKRRKK